MRPSADIAVISVRIKPYSLRDTGREPPMRFTPGRPSKSSAIVGRMTQTARLERTRSRKAMGARIGDEAKRGRVGAVVLRPGREPVMREARKRLSDCALNQ